MQFYLLSAEVLAVIAVPVALTMMSNNPDWKDNDLFKVSKIERDRIRQHVAKSLGFPIRASGAGVSGSLNIAWALEVSGIAPFTPAAATDALTKFRDVRAKKPEKKQQSDAEFKKALTAWQHELDSLCAWSTVINGTQVSWESPSGPWNVGYIEHLSNKIENGEMKWDCTIERKAGGVNINVSTVDTTNLTLTVANSASVMSLVRLVVGQVMRTGKCDDSLKRSFASLRVTWLFAASKDEIVNMSIRENIEQHQRRRHTELDNIFQVKMWMEAMPLLSGKSLDPKKALDVVKYALVMGNPLKPSETPDWLTNLLKDKPPTLENKLNVVTTTSGFNKKFIDDNKIQIEHPEMKSYQRVVQRVRAVVGFCAWEELHEVVLQELSRQGYANKPCPLTSALLLDPKILTAQAMATKSEQENVPLWRDGERGRELQQGMVEVARARLFDHKVLESMQSTKSLFPNGHCWASFARLNGPPQYFLNGVFTQHFGSSEAWSDSVKSAHKALWTGEYDHEIGKLGGLLPSTLDGQPTQMKSQLSTMFTPIAQLVHAQQSEAQRLQSSAQKAEEERKKQEEENAKQTAAETKDAVHDVPGVKEDGDVTEQLCPDGDSAAKKKLCDTLNTQEKKKREEALTQELMLASAAVLRHRLHVVDSLASAKLYMESSSKDGLKGRIVYVDLAQQQSLLTKGRYTKYLITQPDKKFQEDLATQVLAVPMTPIVGTALLRTCNVNMQDYFTKIGNKMSPARTLFVPVDMPPAYEKHIKSGARRALGPLGDGQDREGVMFTMSCVGAREQTQAIEEEAADQDSDDDDDEPMEDVSEVSALEGASLESMTPKQMRSAFGRGTLNMLGAMFQHSSKICEQARFLQPGDFIFHIKDNGKKALMRKGQVHPSVVLSAVKSALSSTSAGVGPQDVFIHVCGGTPEACIAAILAGFSNVIYVASPQEQKWMKLPSEAEESMHKIDYNQYNSPNVDEPDEGILAAEAVRMLTPYIRNHVFDKPNVVKVAPPTEIQVPPLRTYTFIAVTGRVVARTVLPSGGTQVEEVDVPSKKSKTSEKSEKSEKAENSEKSEKSQKSKSSGGPGSASGSASFQTPKKKGVVSADKKDGEDDDAGDDEADDDEEEEGDVEEDEVAALEALEAAAGGTPSDSGKKRGRPKKGAAGKASSKKKAKQ